MQISFCTDGETWNRVVLQLRGTLYHCWEWGEVRKAGGWVPWRVLAEVDGQPRALVQILEKRLPMGAGSLLYARRGIAGSDDDPLVVKELIAWLRAFARERNAILLRMDPEFLDTDETRKPLLLANGLLLLPDQWSFWNLARSNMVVDIRGTEQETLLKMRQKHRQHINRALRDDHLIQERSEISLREFYDLLLRSSQRQGFPVYPFNYLCRVRDNFVAGGRGLLLIARKSGRAVAGIICTRFGSVCNYLYGGFDWEDREVHASEALHWTAIQWAKSFGCTRYDLGGTGTSYPPKEGNEGYGLYHFKKGFGAELAYSAGYFDLVSNKLLYHALRFAERNPSLIDAAIKLRSLF
jgi:peptidoglycan pentaglycine glycine transferase (the first glycine)